MNFKNLDKPAVRVMIAKDALAFLEQNKFKAESGSYLPDAGDWSFLQYATDSSEEEVKIHIENWMKSNLCRVCALGALWISAILRFNHLTTAKSRKLLEDGVEIRRFIISYLVDFFDREQLDLIETAFEGQIYSWINFFADEESLEAAANFVRHIQQSRTSISDYIKFEYTILKRILENIITNNGTFVP